MNTAASPTDAAAQTGTGTYLEAIVARLREVRTHSPDTRPASHCSPDLPSRKALVEILEGLAAALFPNRLGSSGLSPEALDFFVGNTLDAALRALREQVRRELRFTAEGTHDPAADPASSAAAMVRAFAERLPDIRLLLDSDLLAAYQGDPAARSLDEVLVCYPGLTAILEGAQEVETAIAVERCATTPAKA
jgi:serine O-acetyltransferase